MKRFKGLIGAVLVLAAVYFMPFVTVETKDERGSVWRVPFGTSFSGSTDSTVTFSGFRSAYALDRDSANALHAAEEIKCYGNTYYYRKDSDISLSGYSVKGGFPASVTYSYQKGNACLGWTNDDEVAWEIGELKDADLSIDPEYAVSELEWLVIKDGVAMNPGIYNDFSRLVKQGVPSILRTLIIEGNQRTITDIQLLEEAVVQKVGANEQDAYYRVAVKRDSGIEEGYYTRYSETAEVNPRTVSVYEKDELGKEHETVLFIYRIAG